ncbi:MAG: hypothetical protein HY700_19905, partial [Gemmatimonadetes bacterium]|nr:hypothetical protein [Gemmatimonadota bacterium]
MSHNPDAGGPPVPPDPLYRTVKLDYAVTLPVLGVPVEFSCNTAAGLAAVDESFGGWRGVGVS